MKLRQASFLAFAILVLGLVSPAAAGTKPEVQHFTFEEEPFVLDLSGSFGSQQCDVRLVGYDTGIVNYVVFRDESGVITHDIYVQSLKTVLTNPDSGEVIETTLANVSKAKYTENPDGSLTITEQFNGLNFLYQGENVFTSAGRATATYVVRFDKRGNVISVDVTENFTPHLVHAFPFLCETFG